MISAYDRVLQPSPTGLYPNNSRPGPSEKPLFCRPKDRLAKMRYWLLVITLGLPCQTILPMVDSLGTWDSQCYPRQEV